MKNSVWSAIVLTFVVVVGMGSFGGYVLGKKTGQREGEKIGYSRGYDAAPKQTVSDKYKASNHDKVVSDYNVLVEDYNTLRQNVINYIGHTSTQARTPISCTSNTWGMNNQFTTTNCY